VITTNDPEDQAERRHLETRLHHLIVWMTRSVCKLGRENIVYSNSRAGGGVGGQNLARAASASPAPKIFAVFQTGPDGLDDAFAPLE